MSKAPGGRRFPRLGVSLILLAAAVVAVGWWAVSPSPRRARTLTTTRSETHNVTQQIVPPAPAEGEHTDLPLGAVHCDRGLADAARRNAAGLDQQTVSPYGRPEMGWAAYAPLIAGMVGTTCGPASPAFAAALAAWQSAHGVTPAAGVVDDATLQALKIAWQRARPFVAASAHGCPAPPREDTLRVVPASEAYAGKAMVIRPAALAAYERMLGAARAEVPALSADHQLMTIFSAYRSPASDAARCATENNCQNLVRTTCSAHLTGLAVDLNLGAAPGMPPDSAGDANRRAVVEGPAYRWMAANAGRFGFVPYPFEPWHWEWTGEPV
jgi:hypothetical protein